jgi:hypothetical protein
MRTRILLVFVLIAFCATASAQMPTDLIRDSSYEQGIDTDTLSSLLELGRRGRLEREELVDIVALARAELDALLMTEDPDVDGVMA